MLYLNTDVATLNSSDLHNAVCEITEAIDALTGRGIQAEIDMLRNDELAPIESILEYFSCFTEFTLIREFDFSQYIEEQAYSLGDINRESYIAPHINWDSIAENFKIDYTSVTLGNEEFLVRS